MQNLKPTVLTALQTASALSALTFYYFYPETFSNLPCGSYFELDNVGNFFADDQEIGSEIIFQIDLWGRDSLSDYAIAVDTAMIDIGFTCIYSGDFFEEASLIFHRSTRYKIDYSDPTF